MTNLKKIMALVVATGVIGTASMAYAAEQVKTPADIAAALTGKSITDVNKERAAGKTYGTIAKEADKLEDFRKEMLAQKKAILAQRVKDGKLTQAQADVVTKAIEANQATCDGSATGTAKIGSKYGVGFGNASGVGQGMSQKKGNGQGQMQGTSQARGQGAGRGARMGSANCSLPVSK